MTTAQELKIKVEEAKLGLEKELVGLLEPLIKGVKLEATVELTLEQIQVRIIEEGRAQGEMSIMKTYFERVASKEGVERTFASYSNTILMDAAGQIIGTTSKPAVYSYQLISIVFQVIERFYTSKQPEPEVEAEVLETKEAPTA